MIEAAVAVLIFGASLYLIFSERLDRTIASIAGAVLMVGAGMAMRFYTEEQAIAAIDFRTLGLLLGMMTLVALLEPTGFFQYLAVRTGQLSRGNPIWLLVLLGAVTSILSMFLDNVTTVVLIAPVTIMISEILGVPAVPLLMAEALLSNTGGVATLIGDPPNVLIGSAAGLSFNDFLTHSLPVVIIVWLVALLLLRYLFRAELCTAGTNVQAVLEMNPTEALHDPTTARRVLIVLVTAIIFFFFQESIGVTPAMIALAAAAAALVWIRPNVKKLLEGIEWSVLAFFVALFVMVGGLEATGVLRGLAGIVAQAREVPLVLLGVMVIWVAAALSAVVDNVPITIALIPVIESLGAAGLEISPLWWALAFGAGFGGNATIIGSTANVVVAALSERTRTPITSTLWNRRGLPVMLATCAAATLLYILLFPIFRR